MKKELQIIQLLELLNALEKKISNSFRIDPGVTLSQFRALDIISNHPMIRPSELSNLLGITRASTSAILRDLETAELIEQLPDSKDKRSSLIKNTEYGEKRLDVCYQNLEILDKKLFKKNIQSVTELIKLF